jgi:thiamine kinase-like enzyme
MSIETLLENIDLGDLTTTPEQLTGGFQHQIYKVTTSNGVYAIKEIGAHKNNPEFFKTLEQNEKISYEFNLKGINTVRVIIINDKVVHEVGDKAYIIYPWFEGTPLENTDTSLEYSKQAGSILGKIHKEQIACGNSEIMPLAYENIEELENKLKTKPPLLSENLDWLIELNSQYIESKLLLNKDLVFSHRDMDLKNTMVKDGVLYVIDWEDAGCINPTEELINTALSWSGLHNKEVKEDLFREFIKSYKSESNLRIENIDEGFMVCLSYWVNWVKFNIKQLIENESNETAKQEIILTIKVMKYFEQNISLWKSWI